MKQEKSFKKVGFKALAFLSAFVLAFTALMFSNRHYVEAAKKINHAAATLCVGEKTKLTIGDDSRGIKWVSSNKEVATVKSSGTVTAKKKGTATITGTYRGKQYKCKVTVQSTLKVLKTNYRIDDSAPLDIEIEYKAKKASEIMYSIDDPDVVKCEWDGDWDKKKTHLYITPTGNGQTTIEISNSVNDEILVLNVEVVDFDPTYYDEDDDDFDEDDEEGYEGSSGDYDDEDDEDDDW